MSKNSILILTTDFTPIKNTNGRLAYDLAYKAYENGYKVTVFTTSTKKQGRSTENNITIHRVKRFFMAFQMRQIAKKSDRFDIVISLTQSNKLLYIGNKISKLHKSKLHKTKLHKTKHIQWVQEMRPEIDRILGRNPFLSKLPFWENRYLKAQKKCDHYVVPGRAMQQKLKEHHILPQKISYIPLWTNLNGLHLNDKGNVENQMVNDEGLKKIKTDKNPKFRIIHAGDMGAAYPIKPIIKAAELLKENTEIEFLFIGDSEAHDKLARERDKRALNNMRFIPYQPTGSYKEMLESGDVHLVTFRPEFNSYLVPCKFFSSLAVGRPIIYLGGKESELGKIIEQYGCGDVVEDMNVKILAEIILKYRHDGQYWFTRQEGAINASQEYNPTNSLTAWMDILNKVAT